MNDTQQALITTYVVAFGVLLIFIIFIIVFMLLYKNRQLALVKETELAQSRLAQQSLQAQINEAKALDAERDRIAMDMHDELGSGLSSIKLLSAMVRKELQLQCHINDLKQIETEANAINTSIRDMVWSLSPRHDNLASLGKHILSSAQPILAAAEISVRIANDLTDDQIIVNGYVRQHILQMTKELINNVVKHAQASQVEILLYQQQHCIHIALHDNGIGITDANVTASSSNGMYGLQLRAKKIGAELLLQRDASQGGTLARITLQASKLNAPLPQDAL
jgi:signal transduction histidine kinase